MKKGKKKKKNKLGRILASFIAAVAFFVYAVQELELLPVNIHNVTGERIGQLEIPQMGNGKPHQHIAYTGYSLSYNRDTRLPNWVAYELTAAEAEGDNPRKDRFRRDPRAHGPQGDKADYKHSGWDRGHMAPAADFKWSEEAMDETYFFTNICPQNTQLNGGDWKELEDQCRTWAKKYGSLYIVCGPVVQENIHGRLGENGIVIPDKFYKAVLAPVAGGYKHAGFIFENPPQRKSKISGKPPVKRPLKSYMVTIREIEEITGIDFFPLLPDETENMVETSNRIDL